MNDPILLFLVADAVALALVGTCAAVVPPARFLITMLSGLGTLLCLPPLFMNTRSTAFGIPIGPPGLSLHVAIDKLSASFLIIALLAGTAIAAAQALAVSLPQVSAMRMTACCLAGTVLALLAADGVTLSLGLAATCAATGRGSPRTLVPMLIFTAVCLLTPAGYAPRFDAIRTVPIDPDHATAATALTVAAVAGLVRPYVGARCGALDALVAGVQIPFASYLLLRLIVDLAATGAQVWWGFILLLAGGAAAVIQGWRSSTHPDIDTAVAALMRRQAGLAVGGIGLALVARAADLPGAATYALEAICLTAVGTALAGTVTALCAHVVGIGAGTYRLSSLGGLVHSMPATSVALSAGLLTASALPPSLGFVALWLSFQSILSAPRTGGLAAQLALALIGAAIALSAALATTASVRIVGIAILGRPRTPRGAGAVETHSLTNTILLVLSGVSLMAGALPGLVLWLLVDPAVHALTGLPSGRGLALLSVSGASSGYLALPVLTLLAFATWAVMLVSRRSHKQAKIAGPWTDGMPPPHGLPFGDPAAQSAGQGFLPALPAIPLPDLPRFPALPKTRLPPAISGLWLIISAFAALLLILACIQ